MTATPCTWSATTNCSATCPSDPEASLYLGQDLVSQIFQRYPQIAHLVPRDLLWFFGGDCLHFMPDEEIEMYQALEERRFYAGRKR